MPGDEARAIADAIADAIRNAKNEEDSMTMESGVRKALQDQPGGNLEKYVDRSMYEAAPMETTDKGVRPKVSIVWMTPDPLGAIAAACRMYEGIPTPNIEEVTDEERRHYLEQVQQTHLTAPLEFVKIHFFIEGVSRSFTHQIVRQRTAVFAQESLRFAVKENLAQEVVLPPSIAALPNHHPTRQMWDHHMGEVQNFYNFLIGNGIPAEDAREVLPHAVATRLNFATDLRNLVDHAGNRLCTQAQLHWREVFRQIVEGIRDYYPDFSFMPTLDTREVVRAQWAAENRWQFDALADSGMFKPVCYQLGRCPFQASFDRGCTIRERVELNASIGRKSSEWGKPLVTSGGDGEGDIGIPAIWDEEWMLDPQAAWQ